MSDADAREPWTHVFAGEFVVVVSEQHELVGNGDARPAAGHQQLKTDEIVEGKESAGLGELLEPVLQLVCRPGPGQGIGPDLKRRHVGVAAACPDGTDKGLVATSRMFAVGTAPFGSTVAVTLRA